MNKIVPIKPAIAIPNDITEEQKLSIQSILESDNIIVSKAEYEQMKVDAERYMYMKTYDMAVEYGVYISNALNDIEQPPLDEAIDKAMKG
jgi:hypothetical protein